ncbi:hypothetical protein F5B21DRAFT_217876 [Xylaria acuta]|nr:hypothetical protein F5B21DRAFT_217876 [Xylaria acuta]
MQVIPALLFLALPFLAEAGPLRAPRTASPNAQTYSEFQIITSSAPSPTPTATAPATFILSPPTSTALPYGFVAIVESASTSDPAPTEAPALNQAGDQIVEGGSKFVQTTFWACETFPKETHCGWHEPILDVSNAAVAAPNPRGVLVRAGVVAACVVGVLFYGF